MNRKTAKITIDRWKQFNESCGIKHKNIEEKKDCDTDVTEASDTDTTDVPVEKDETIEECNVQDLVFDKLQSYYEVKI